MFQPAVPAATILEKVHNRTYILPAIQREFIWKTEQIRVLFDSLMRGYPIGAFLFWEVGAVQATRFTFYDFIQDYHEKEQPYAAATRVPPGQGAIAILDGQQRLTALHIGLYGSHAERIPRRWWTSPDAFPRKRLHLNLVNSGEENDLGMEFDFQFLTAEEATGSPGEPDRWFLVSDILEMEDAGPAIVSYVETRGLPFGETYKVLYTLYRAIRETPSINAYLETSQDADKVLDIFVRVNSGGTPLSYSDLLLSMATNQWKTLDAREEVRTLVGELNSGPTAFEFNKDLVLKAGLVLIDVPDIGFKVSNFTQANMAQMETNWGAIQSALLLAARLLASFGYSGRTLSASYAMIPIAYYLNGRQRGASYVDSSRDASDRAAIRTWVARSLMKRGIWSSGVDTLLGRLRDAIRSNGKESFPADDLELAMPLGKSLAFTEAEISELLDLRYGSSRVFPVLATLYPGLDFTKAFHEDHIYPRSLFTKKKNLLAAGVPEHLVAEYQEKSDTLPNLQLLAGGPNIEKEAMLPTDWLKGPNFPTEAARDTYVNENDLTFLPQTLAGFLDFHRTRRTAIEERLRAVLGTVAPDA
jgi:hypothetical protein